MNVFRFVALAHVLVASAASAQACCTGAGTFSPARLKLWENVLVGTQLRAQMDTGSFDAEGRFIRNPPGASEQDFEEDVLGVFRLGRGGQAGLLVPFDESHRRVPGFTELGGGLGDLQLFGRYDFTLTGTPGAPLGFAVLASTTFPTGRPPEQARLALGSDATGAGAFQGALGVALERALGGWVLNATATLTGRTARHVDGVRSQLAPQLAAFLGAAYAFPEERSLGVTLSYSTRGAPLGAATSTSAVQGLGNNAATVSVVGSSPLWEHWRLQGSLFEQPPLSGLGQNQVIGMGLTVVLLRSFT